MVFFGLFSRGAGKKEPEIVRVIDVEGLLKEISPEAPSGAQDLEYDPVFMKLEEEIKGTPEVRHGDKIVQERKEPKWSEIQTTSLTLLARAHDLRVAVALLRALVHNHSAPGLRDGLQLLHGLVDQRWDTFYPQLDPDDDLDPTMRVNILLTLCDFDTMILPMMNMPLCASRAVGRFSLRDVQIASGKLTVSEEIKQSAPEMSTIEAAFRDVEPKELAATGGAVADSVELVKRLESLLMEKIGVEAAPRFTELSRVLKEMDACLAKYDSGHFEATPSGPTPEEEIAETAPVETAGGARTTPARAANSMDTIASRQDVVSLLNKICAYYADVEPASPVPLLLKRAIRLVDKDFMAIIEDMAPDSIDRIKQISGPES